MERVKSLKASALFKKIEERIPRDLSLPGDRAGFAGPGDPDHLDVENVLVLMDYCPDADREYGSRDLTILHHPPIQEPDIPCYIIHSNWDIVQGGACDALADCLGITTEGILDEMTGLGRVGKLPNGSVPLVQFAWEVMIRLHVPDLRIVNFVPDRLVGRIGLVSGFGLNTDLVRVAQEQCAEVLLSGDLTHAGAMLAMNIGIVLVDVPHYTTEIPGLYRLGTLLGGLGVRVQVRDTGVPWNTISQNKRF